MDHDLSLRVTELTVRVNTLEKALIELRSNKTRPAVKTRFVDVTEFESAIVEHVKNFFLINKQPIRTHLVIMKFWRSAEALKLDMHTVLSLLVERRQLQRDMNATGAELLLYVDDKPATVEQIQRAKLTPFAKANPEIQAFIDRIKPMHYTQDQIDAKVYEEIEAGRLPAVKTW